MPDGEPKSFNEQLKELMDKKGRKTFLVDVLVLDQRVRAPLSAVSLESITCMATIFVATNWPNVHGFIVYTEDGSEVLAVVDGTAFANHFANSILQVTGRQVLKGAVPVIGATEKGQDLVNLMNEAKNRGKMMGDRGV